MSNQSMQITPFDGYGGGGSGGGELAEYGQGQGLLGRPAALPGGAGGNGGGSEPHGSMFRTVHQSLRGRYWIAVSLGIVLGLAGGYLGWKSQQPIYRGEGMLQIQYQMKTAMPGADSGPMLNFEEYLQSQAMVIQSRKIIDAAMHGPDWRLTKLPDDLATLKEIAKNLTVEHPIRTELIRVFYTDKDPEVAANVVRAVILAYYNYAAQRNIMEMRQVMHALEDRRQIVLKQIKDLEGEILDRSNVYGTSDLGPMVEAKFNEEEKLGAQLHQAEMALDAAKLQKDKRQMIYDLTESQIAILDPYMRTLTIERQNLEGQLGQLKAAGRLEENAQVKQIKSMLEASQAKINKYAAEWRDLQMKISDDPSLASGGIGRYLPMSEKVLAGEVVTLKAKYEKLKGERTEMGKVMVKIQDLQRQREEIVKERQEVQNRLNVLQMESMLASRLSIINPGEVPISPFKDRRKLVGAAGAMAGFGLPIGVFVLLGLMDRRYRYSDETDNGVANVPLLGILPRLPDKLSDPEQAAVAAHCIHQIRIMLQVGENPEARRVFMITSASTGDGKTSLTMALGLSFAASGSKTLVIDCDMVGQGLTHRLKAHGVAGLLETLNTGTLRGHVRKTATKGLYVLPIGNADAAHAGGLSRQGMQRLIEACREHFDIIVIDTGPILGSLEASVVATEADGVIMAVARGQQQPLVEKAIKHLRSIGAHVFGIVFNRAEQRDFQRSVASASIRSLSARPHEPRGLLPEADESSRFGPLARSVASYLPPAGAGTTGTPANGNAYTNGNGNGHANGNGQGAGGGVSAA